MTDIIILANPASGTTKGRKIIEQIENYCLVHHIPFTTFQSESSEHLKQLTLQIAQDYNTNQKVIVIGGDGTLHQVIQTLSLHHQDIPIGFIPSGTGNDFARSTTGKKDPLIIFENILSLDTPTSLPILKTHDHVAINSFGVGFDALVCHYVEQSTIKPFLNRIGLGFLSYAILIIKSLFNFKTFSISVEDTYYENVVMATFLNNPRFGGGINLDPSLSITDEHFHLVLIHSVTFKKIVSLLYQLLRKKHLSHPCVITNEFKQVRVHFNATSPTQADGETTEFGTPPMTITLSHHPFWLCNND